VSVRCLLGALLLVSACSAPTSPCGPTRGKVARIIDGDTVEMDSGERIRLLLVDTPETTQGKNDCYGQQAKAFTTMALEGKEVELSYDVQCQDRFGRTLAYVKQGSTDVNAELVKQGLACVLYLSPNGEARRMEFEDYESVAKTNRTGMWGSCTTITCD
jgi:micrococcal nuclease